MDQADRRADASASPSEDELQLDLDRLRTFFGAGASYDLGDAERSAPSDWSLGRICLAVPRVPRLDTGWRIPPAEALRRGAPARDALVGIGRNGAADERPRKGESDARIETSAPETAMPAVPGLEDAIRPEDVSELLRGIGVDYEQMEREIHVDCLEDSGPDASAPRPLILIVEPSEATGAALAESAARPSFQLAVVTSAADGVPVVEAEGADVALAIIAVDDVDRGGLRLASLIRKLHPDASVIVTARAGSEALAVEALRLGVDDYLHVPLAAEEASSAVGRSLARRAARRVSRVRLTALRQWTRKLERLATLDPLTGLYNRRYLDARLDGELRRIARKPAPLAVALVDLDGFKGLNDARGHRAGDRFLAKVGRALRSRCRASDVACRYGGDEFAVILPDTDAEGAHAAAEAIREALRSLLPAERGDQDESGARQAKLDGERLITASIGVAASPECGATAASLIAAADEALYRAKDAGRDRVMMARALVLRPHKPSSAVDEAKSDVA